jgi:hypothetical protein
MPRKRNAVGIAAGKLIVAIRAEVAEEPDDAIAHGVMHRAHTLLQAAQSGVVPNLLDGRSVVEYLDPVWVAAHPSVEPSIDALVAALRAIQEQR